MAASYLSPKTEVRKSAIHGHGLFARRAIRKGEIVAIKGGHVLNERALAAVKSKIAYAYIQIDDGFYLGAVKPSEVPRNKIWLNHSCQPNVGIRGQSAFVAMRHVKAGEELTYDWAMEENSEALTRCTCGRPRCRGVLTGEDWRKPELQRRYEGFFSSYLAEKIRTRRARARAHRS
jgi:SET domain-containing protein